MPADVLLAYGAVAQGGAASSRRPAAIAAVIAFRRARDHAPARFWGVAALSLSVLAAVQLAIAGFDAFSPMRSTSAILRAAQASAPFAADAPFYQIEMYDQTVPFYLERPTTLVDYRDELALGIDAEPGKADPNVRGVDAAVALARAGLRDDVAGALRSPRGRRRSDARARARFAAHRREPALICP